MHLLPPVETSCVGCVAATDRLARPALSAETDLVPGGRVGGPRRIDQSGENQTRQQNRSSAACSSRGAGSGPAGPSPSIPGHPKQSDAGALERHVGGGRVLAHARRDRRRCEHRGRPPPKPDRYTHVGAKRRGARPADRAPNRPGDPIETGRQAGPGPEHAQPSSRPDAPRPRPRQTQRPAADAGRQQPGPTQARRRAPTANGGPRQARPSAAKQVRLPSRTPIACNRHLQSRPPTQLDRRPGPAASRASHYSPPATSEVPDSAGSATGRPSHPSSGRRRPTPAAGQCMPNHVPPLTSWR